MSDSHPEFAVRPWSIEGEETIARTPIFELRRRVAASPRDPSRRGAFVYLDSPDWVNVVALTPERDVVLIEQYRHGLAQVTLEIPGGMIDAGESPLRAGERELLEETGYAGRRARVLGRVSPNPAFLDNYCYTVLVEEAVRRAEPALDPHEEISVTRAPLAHVPELVRRGRIHHALVVAAFHWLVLDGLLE